MHDRQWITRLLRRGLTLILLATFYPLLQGCSSPTDASQVKPSIVRGVVAYNGRPLMRGTVTFLPQDRGGERIDPGIATIGPDGTFWVGNSNLSKPAGLQPGKYKVTVLVMKPRPEGAIGPLAALEIPERYTQESTTPIEVTIKPGQSRIRIDLVDEENPPKASPSSSPVSELKPETKPVLEESK
ncbi:hypothetical protein K2Y11_19405 [bacterium]|nr:hypothetical protein [bacterium]